MVIKENETQKSIFVTVVAWIFIAATGFGTLITLLQNIMITTMFPMAEMQEAFNNQDEFKDMPFFAKFLFEHFQFYFLFMFFLTTATLATSIGLLKRKNWVRKTFIFILGFGILFALGGFVIQLSFFDPMSQGLSEEQIPVEFTRMMTIMKIFMFIITAAITGVFGWIIKKLLSKHIVEEFLQTNKMS